IGVVAFLAELVIYLLVIALVVAGLAWLLPRAWARRTIAIIAGAVLMATVLTWMRASISWGFLPIHILVIRAAYYLTIALSIALPVGVMVWLFRQAEDCRIVLAVGILLTAM